ncbi:hypothetical protein OKW47_000582 [Paraburkholderia atlantica]
MRIEHKIRSHGAAVTTSVFAHALHGQEGSRHGGGTPAGGTSWNREAVLGGNGRTCMDSTTAEPCEGVRVAFYRATPTEAA